MKELSHCKATVSFEKFVSTWITTSYMASSLYMHFYFGIYILGPPEGWKT